MEQLARRRSRDKLAWQAVMAGYFFLARSAVRLRLRHLRYLCRFIFRRRFFSTLLSTVRHSSQLNTGATPAPCPPLASSMAALDRTDHRCITCCGDGQERTATAIRSRLAASGTAEARGTAAMLAPHGVRATCAAVAAIGPLVGPVAVARARADGTSRKRKPVSRAPRAATAIFARAWCVERSRVRCSPRAKRAFRLCVYRHIAASMHRLRWDEIAAR